MNSSKTTNTVLVSFDNDEIEKVSLPKARFVQNARIMQDHPKCYELVMAEEYNAYMCLYAYYLEEGPDVLVAAAQSLNVAKPEDDAECLAICWLIGLALGDTKFMNLAMDGLIVNKTLPKTFMEEAEKDTKGPSSKEWWLKGTELYLWYHDLDTALKVQSLSAGLRDLVKESMMGPRKRTLQLLKRDDEAKTQGGEIPALPKLENRKFYHAVGSVANEEVREWALRKVQLRVMEKE